MPTLTATLMRARRLAESLMVDSCLIRRKTGEATDNTTGVVTPTYSTIYSGKCRVQQRAAAATPTDVGQAAVWLEGLELQVPMSVTGIQVNDLVTITASVLDPDLLNRTWHVRGLAHKTHATSRRFQIEEVTG